MDAQENCSMTDANDGMQSKKNGDEFDHFPSLADTRNHIICDFGISLDQSYYVIM